MAGLRRAMFSPTAIKSCRVQSPPKANSAAKPPRSKYISPFVFPQSFSLSLSPSPSVILPPFFLCFSPFPPALPVLPPAMARTRRFSPASSIELCLLRQGWCRIGRVLPRQRATGETRHGAVILPVQPCHYHALVGVQRAERFPLPGCLPYSWRREGLYYQCRGTVYTPRSASRRTMPTTRPIGASTCTLTRTIGISCLLGAIVEVKKRAENNISD